MKKIIVVLALALVVLSLTACDPAHYNYNHEELKNNVVRVELINYDNPDAKELFEKRDKVIAVNLDKIEVVETLSEDKVNDFLLDFSKILFLEYWRHSDSPRGTCVRIVYENGDFEVVSHEVVYAGRFDSEGNVVEFVGGLSGRNNLINLVNKYFITQI